MAPQGSARTPSTRVICPACERGSAGPPVLTEGVFSFTCTGCDSTWSVRVAMFAEREPFDVERFRTAMLDGLTRAGITRTELAALLDVSAAYVSMVLHGRRVPSEPRRWLEAVGVRDLPVA